MAFSRIGWLDQPREVAGQRFLAGLLRVLRLVQADWSGFAQGVSRVGSSGDAHQILLDILGLHPDSAEYYWRYSQSLTELYNVINLWGPGPQFWNDTSASASESRYTALYKVEPRITTSSTQLVADYITSHLAGLSESADLADQIAGRGEGSSGLRFGFLVSRGQPTQ